MIYICWISSGFALAQALSFPCSVICRIYLGIHVLQFFRIIRAVTVPDRVCSPSFQQFQCLRHHVPHLWGSSLFLSCFLSLFFSFLRLFSTLHCCFNHIEKEELRQSAHCSYFYIILRIVRSPPFFCCIFQRTSYIPHKNNLCMSPLLRF